MKLEHLFPELTKRQADILKAVAQGYNNAYIGNMEAISERTVEYHVGNLIDILIDENAHVTYPEFNSRVRLGHLFHSRVGEAFFEVLR